MVVRHAGVPPEIAQASLRTVRARDVKTYAQSHKDLARLEARGLLHRLAEGFYVVVPHDRVGSEWRPTLEGAAAGIGAAEFGPGQYALMSLTAARLHRAIPRDCNRGGGGAPSTAECADEGSASNGPVPNARHQHIAARNDADRSRWLPRHDSRADRA